MTHVPNDKQDPPALDQSERLKLDAFGRDAAAMIAFTRGLTGETQSKLDVLAARHQLSESLYARAMQELQLHRADDKQLTHHEQAFVDFLDTELSRLKNGVLPLQAHQRAVDLACDKYQLTPDRAALLIQQRTERASILHISPADAASYAKQFLRTQIDQQRSLDEARRAGLIQQAVKLGVSAEQADLEIEHCLQKNKRARRARAQTATGWLLLGTICLAGLGYSALTLRNRFNIGNDTTDRRNDRQTSHQQADIAESLTLLEPTQKLDWMWPDTWRKIQQLDLNSLTPEQWRDQLANPSPELRKRALLKLADHAMQLDSQSNNDYQDVFCHLMYEEPDEENVTSVLQKLTGSLQDLLPSDTLNVDAFRKQFAVNRLLTALFFSPHQNTVLAALTEQRRQTVAEALQRVNGLTPYKHASDQYLRLAEEGLSVDQWNFLLQQSWQRPGEVAYLLPKLTDLTNHNMPPARQHRLQLRVLMFLIRHHSAQWINLQQSIRDSILASDEHEMEQWAESIFQSTDQSFVKFASTILLEKTGLKRGVNNYEQPRSALLQWLYSQRRQRYRILLNTSESLAIRVDQILSSVSANGLQDDPDTIARMADLILINLTLMSHIENGIEISIADADRIETALQNPTLRLRDRIAASRDLATTNAVVATAADERQKVAAVYALSKHQDNASGERMRAINELAGLARKFADLNPLEAEIMSGYILSQLPADETLNVQRRLPAFTHWPQLRLAIANRILNLPSSHTTDDTTLTQERILIVARILFQADFLINFAAPDWKETLYRNLLQLTAQQLQTKQQVSLLKSSEDRDWILLQIFLGQAYASFLGSNPIAAPPTSVAAIIANKATPSPASNLLRVISAQESFARLDIESQQQVMQTMKLIQNERFSELEKAVLANQLLFELLAQDTRMLSKHDAALAYNPIQLNLDLKATPTLGNRLHDIEIALLKLGETRRRMLTQKLLNEKTKTIPVSIE